MFNFYFEQIADITNMVNQVLIFIEFGAVVIKSFY